MCFSGWINHWGRGTVAFSCLNRSQKDKHNVTRNRTTNHKLNSPNTYTVTGNKDIAAIVNKTDRVWRPFIQYQNLHSGSRLSRSQLRNTHTRPVKENPHRYTRNKKADFWKKAITPNTPKNIRKSKSNRKKKCLLGPVATPKKT